MRFYRWQLCWPECIDAARIGNQLCELENHNPLLRERYTQEIQAMLEKKLTFGWKLFLAAVAIASTR